MAYSYRNSQQRFHKGRQSRILVPHDGQAGILFTINPMQGLRARREAQNYLTSLTADLQASSHGTPRGGITAEKNESEEENVRPEGEVGEPQRAGTTSSLLAMELSAAVSRGPGKKRPREGPGSEKGGLVGEEVASAPRWFHELETSCKGYLLLRVPTLAPEKTCVLCHASKTHLQELPPGTAGAPEDANPQEPSEEKAPEKSGDMQSDKDGEPMLNRGTLPAHTIVINPLVSHLVERIFRDLHENPRPIFKHSFRMIPVELTCCPTLPEMQAALRKLIEVHFPPNNQASIANAHESLSEIAFTRVLDVAPAKKWPMTSAKDEERTHCADNENRSNVMHKVGFRLIIKNNSNVEAKKMLYLSELHAAFPANRFIVFPPSHIDQKRENVNKPHLEAVVCVMILHATCIMGVQPLFFERDAYNMHDISEKTLVLTNSVTRLQK
ncbi:unnamed protein product [Phytomonas sp. Hart1]|nr:unnamed protein product [Phytomonas sp. Hart1]|eukprot:CCW71917.1 unnamed protein product [Phytomonas sp. isolate Hart1]